MSETTGPYLDFDLDPAVWMIGPTPARPVEEWLPAATDVKAEIFQLGPAETEKRAQVRDVLGLTARRHPSPLPYFVIRWQVLEETPFVLFFGLVERDAADSLGRDWVTSADVLTFEPPVVDELTAPKGVRLTRGLSYSTDEEGHSVIAVRYTVDTGHPDALVLAHAASDVPAQVLSGYDDVEALLRTVTVTDTPPVGT